MIEPEHSRLAPSSAHIWSACPGSVAMQERQPPEEETDEQREGTAAHWLLAQVLAKLTVPENEVAPNGVPVNDEMREAIKEIVVDINDTLLECERGDYYQVERTVGAYSVHPELWGTPDCYFLQFSRKTLHIWDFKYGHRFVDVFELLQLVAYAMAVFEDAKVSDWRDWVVTFTIAQPRCYVRDELGGTLREWITSARDLTPLIDRLTEAAHRATTPGAPCVTGAHCLDCRAAYDCEANQRAGGAAIDLIQGQQSLNMAPEAIGLEMRQLEIAFDRVKARLGALEAKAMALIDEGQSVPYHRVDFTQPRTLWNKERQEDAAQIVSMFSEGIARLGVALPTPRECIKLGIDESVIRPYVTKAPGAKKLVRVDDNRAVKIFGRR